MVEQDFHSEEEQFENIGREETWEVSPEIQAKMPRSGRTYMQKSAFELFTERIKRLIKGESDSLG